MFKTLGGTAIGLAVFAIPAFAAHDQAEATKAVSTFTDNYTKAFNAKDVTAILTMFAPDGVEAGPGPMLTSETTSRSGSKRSSTRERPISYSTSNKCKPKATSCLRLVNSRSRCQIPSSRAM